MTHTTKVIKQPTFSERTLHGFMAKSNELTPSLEKMSKKELILLVIRKTLVIDRTMILVNETYSPLVSSIIGEEDVQNFIDGAISIAKWVSPDADAARSVENDEIVVDEGTTKLDFGSGKIMKQINKKVVE